MALSRGRHARQLAAGDPQAGAPLHSTKHPCSLMPSLSNHPPTMSTWCPPPGCESGPRPSSTTRLRSADSSIPSGSTMPGRLSHNRPFSTLRKSPLSRTPSRQIARRPRPEGLPDDGITTLSTASAGMRDCRSPSLTRNSFAAGSKPAISPFTTEPSKRWTRESPPCDTRGGRPFHRVMESCSSRTLPW